MLAMIGPCSAFCPFPAAAKGDDPRARAVGFLMALYQRRLASSAHALRHSLENRARRLAEGLKRAQDIALTASDLPDAEDMEEMEEAERDRIERVLEAVTLAQNPTLVREEIADLEELAKRAGALEAEGEAKLAKLKQVLKDQGLFDDPGERLLIFTEFKDTLDYLVLKLAKWGFKVGLNPGGMQIGSRDVKGSRLYAEQQFSRGRDPSAGGDRGGGRGHQSSVLPHHVQLRYSVESEPA
jgi:hypothetical protein